MSAEREGYFVMTGGLSEAEYVHHCDTLHASRVEATAKKVEKLSQDSTYTRFLRRSRHEHAS